MKFIIFFILLQQAIQPGIAEDQNLPFFSEEVSRSDPSSSNDIIAKWKDAEKAVQGVVVKVVQSVIPSAYQIYATTNISDNCTSGLIEYIKGLTDMKLWAFEMLDASGKIPNGIFGGTPFTFGDFDTCIQTVSESNHFRGKYCLLDLSLPLPKRRLFAPVEEEIPEFANVMAPGSISEVLVKHAQYLYTAQLRISICVPSSCTKDDMEMIASKVLKLSKTGFDVVVPYCEEKVDFITFTTGEIFIIILLSSLVSLVITGTVIDVSLHLKSKVESAAKDQNFPLKIILCFSAYANFTRLLKKDNNPESLKIFHGFRVLSMLWVILCHTYFTVDFHAHDGLLRSKDIAKEFLFQPIINGFLAVETFFFMSSVLVVYVCMRMREKVNVPLFFTKRYYRLTPTLMLVVACFCIVGHFGSGPIWRDTVINKLSHKCQDYGWWTLLYVNNYLYSSDMCMGWTWYLSADTHLFVVSLYVIILLKKSPKKGFTAIGFLLIAGMLSTAFSHIYYKLPPAYLQSFLNYEDWYYYGLRGYTPSHFHLPVCCIGLCVGYVLATKTLRIPKHLNSIGWAVTVIMLFCVVFAPYHWNQGNIPGLFVSALYGSTHRVLWASCLAFVTISCFYGYGGIANKFLSWSAFVPFARLTYMVYLIHYGIIYLYTGSARSTITYNHRSMCFQYCGVVVITFISACILSLIFESPFMSLERLLMRRPQFQKNLYTIRDANGTEKNRKESV